MVARVLSANRDEHLEERREKLKVAKDRLKRDKGPPRWQQALSKGTARTTFVVGALLTLPGASYLVALARLAKEDLSPVETVLALLGFNVIMLAFARGATTRLLGGSGHDARTGGALQGFARLQRSSQGGAPRPLRLQAETSPNQLPAPHSGEVAVSQGGRVLSIGGVDSDDVSTSSVLGFDPSSGRTAPAGSLSQPLHDAAAAALPAGTLVFGGGSAATIDEVERLRPGATGAVVGHLPNSSSDLSTIRAGADAIVLGGYDGAQPLDTVLRTADGSSFTNLAPLPVAVPYPSVATDGSKVYVLGGELASGLDSSQIQAVDLVKGTASGVGRLPGPLFDAASARAKLVGHLPAPIQNAAAATEEGIGYLIGGLDPQGSTLSSIVTVKLMPQSGGAAAK